VRIEIEWDGAPKMAALFTGDAGKLLFPLYLILGM
jgi:hypothetical protein